MTEINVTALSIVVINHGYPSGHEVQVNGTTVAWRVHDGAYNDTVASEVAGAFGELLLGKLRETHNDAQYPGERDRWQKEEPEDDWGR